MHLESEDPESAPEPPLIYVLAGTNGAGKSSIGGAFLRAQPGGSYFNPDEYARRIRQLQPELSQEEANSVAWHEGVAQLERAIERRENHAFETTLGASRTILGLLERAASEGFEIYIWYAGLSSPELHIERVRKRVEQGGHDIPEELIRKRYHQSRENLIRLLPILAGLRVFDNSADADPATGNRPQPKLLLHFERGRVLDPKMLPENTTWAQKIVEAAFLVQIL